MGIKYCLKCIDCMREYEPNVFYKCPECNGILDVTYQYETIQGKYIKNNKQLKQALVFHDNEIWQLFGEGNTPLLPLQFTSEKLGAAKLFAKCEFLNPSGSFKDRPVAAGMKKAIDFGYQGIIVASSGNGAASVASYAARFGLKSVILVPDSTPEEKIKQSLTYGSQVIKVKGPYSNCFNLALKMSQEGNLYNLTTTFLNPYTVEGDKAVSFEIHDQMEQWPDYVIVPIGSGPLLVGIYKGFKEINKIFKLGRKIPRMIGVQASGCSPISKAYQKGASHVFPEKNPKTIAGGIGDGLNGYSEDGTYTLSVIRESNGVCIDVSDEEIITAQNMLAEYEGLFVEPSAAAALAAVRNSTIKEIISDQSILLILTGHGLKDMNSVVQNSNGIPCIEPNVEQLSKLIS